MISTETSLSVIGFDDLANGVIVVREGGAIMGANKAMVAMLGMDIDALIGQPFASVLTQASTVLYEGVLAQQLRGAGVVPETCLDFRHHDGEELATVCSAALHEQGPNAFVVISVTTLAGRRRIEEDLSRRLDDMLRDRESRDAANAARSEFLARVSHELRTPLNAILGFAQVLALDKMQPLQSLQRSRVSHIEEAGRDLLSLVDEVLDISEIDSGLVVEEPQWINVKSLLSRVSRLVEETALARNVHLNLAAHSTFSVYADPERLAQILTNLLRNSVRFANDGGTVTATCVVVDRKLTISVHDTGPGLDAEELAHLFEPFNSHGHERATIQGTGLGLVIVKRLVEAMEGTINVTSTPTRGSTFEVVLPQRLRHEEAGEPAVAVPLTRTVPARRLPTVLYVEDNPVNAMIMQAICEMQSGMLLRVETSAADGLAYARENPVDLYLLDMNLPDADGIQLLSQLRRHAHEKNVEVEAIAVSADASPDLMERAQDVGFSQYWTKPLNVDATLDKLAWSLGIPRTLHASSYETTSIL